MRDLLQFYIDGAWVDPIVPKTLDVIDPSTEQPFAKISVGAKADVDRAVAAAKRDTRRYAKRQVTFGRHQLPGFAALPPEAAAGFIGTAARRSS